MFDGREYPISLDEETFENWLESGRQHKLGFNYLLIIFDAIDHNYKPIYVENRQDIWQYEDYASSTSQESLIAAYDLYSESRMLR